MLTTAAVHDRSLDRAMGELMENARRLAVGGLAHEAFEALRLLLQGGPWRLPAHDTLVHQLKRLLPPVSLLAGEPCADIGDQAAIPLQQQSEWAEQAAREQLRSLALVGRNQLRPAGAEWSPSFLSTLPERRGGPGDDRPHVAFGAFCVDAEFVLKARIAQRFDCSTAIVEIPSAEELQGLGLPADELALLLAQLQRESRVDIAAAAEAIDTLEIARATAGYLRSTGFSGGYLPPIIFLASWLLLVEEGRELAAVEVAGAWLAQDRDACARMIDFAAVPSVGRFLRAGTLAQAVQVDSAAARDWLATLQSRRMAEAVPGLPDGSAPTPADTAEAFLASLQGTPLQSLRWLRVPVPDSSEHAFVASIPVPDRKQLWQEARALIERTARWPLVTTLWSASNDPPDVNRLAEELFTRFPYEQGPARDDISPRSFIASSQSIDVDEFLAQLAGRDAPLDDETQLRIWRSELSAAGLTLGGFDQAWVDCRGDRMRFERWLADQEAAHGQADPDRGRQPAFEPDNAWLVLLPTPHSEDALAYIHWFGIERGTADGFIRLLRTWRESHGAELFAHYGTMLEFVVRRPPMDLDAALQLAREHELAAPCTLILPGIPQRHHALGLVGHGEWFLHERP
jgi:hypothetical protein